MEVDRAARLFVQHIIEIVNIAVTTFVQEINRTQHWITQGILPSIKEKRIYIACAKKTNYIELKDKYCILQNRLTKLIKLATHDYIQNHIIDANKR